MLTDRAQAPLDVVVVGTFAVGMTVRVPRPPAIGETLMGDAFHLGPGGKGSNMATAASRLGARAGLIATVGVDIFGDMAYDHFAREAIDTGGLRRVVGKSTHVGLAFVLPTGLNMIAGDAGASNDLGIDDVRRAADRIRQATVLIVELGAPDDAVAEAIGFAVEGGTTVVLNPAPARNLPSELLRHVDFFTPNETEARILLGLAPDDDSASASELAGGLHDGGPRTVIVTCGQSGCVVADVSGRRWTVPSYPVEAFDTVGAGDAFNGGLAAALAQGMVGLDAIRWASVTAALSTEVAGTIDGLPDAARVQAAMNSWAHDLGLAISTT